MHSDLWAQVVTDILRLGPDAVRITWIKGHAKQSHVDRGITTKEDKYGNDHADTLAGIGRDLRQVSAVTRLGHLTRKTATMIVQKMIVQIFMERQDHRDEMDKERLAPLICDVSPTAPPEDATLFKEGRLEDMEDGLWQNLISRYGMHLLAPIEGPLWSFQLGPIPPRTVVRIKWKSFDPSWLLPLHWYWSQLRFPGLPKAMALLGNDKRTSDGISWMELVIDCEMATPLNFCTILAPIRRPLAPLV